MDELYIEAFFKRDKQAALEPAAQQVVSATPLSAPEKLDLIFQAQHDFRLLKDEVRKELQDRAPFPLIMKKIEEELLGKRYPQALELLNKLEELIDLQF